MESLTATLLREFVNASLSEDRITANKHRKQFIERKFDAIGLPKYQLKGEGWLTGNNIETIYYRLSPKKKHAIMLCAHYDILNPDSENANDNSASIINLIVMCQENLSLLQELPFNIIIAFTDEEERGGSGASLLANYLTERSYVWVPVIINLELTGKGKHIFIEAIESKIKNKIKELHPEITELSMPFSDANVFRMYKLDAVTITTLPISVGEEPDNSIWKRCHTEEDNFENISLQDMHRFRNEFLLPLLNKLAIDYEKQDYRHFFGSSPRGCCRCTS